MENKQTAVEWLYQQLLNECLIDMADELFLKAEQMEKEKIKKAYEAGCAGEIFELNCNESSESYYQKNYGKQ